MSRENSYTSIYTHGKQSGESDSGSTGDHPEVSPLKAQRSFPDWARSAVLYEVNIRQFTPEGTFRAFTRHLPRIKDLGIDIIWLMPVHPIGEVKRKGSLGSPYSVANYLTIHPDYGDLADFQFMLEEAHRLGLKVIIDWVANHTAWDHPWITNNPDFYRYIDGEIITPFNTEKDAPWGWDDVAGLDFENGEMREAMINALLFWVREVGIDGIRFDVAHQVPNDFWLEATEELYKEKPLFLLAESEMPEHVNTGSFVANYAWEYMHIMNQYAKGKAALSEIDAYFEKDRSRVQRGFHLYFTTNHDENAWAGTVFERFGDGHLAFAVLAATIDGMPLIYGGQEAPIRKRLDFYERDPIDWQDYNYTSFYQKLFALKHRNRALWNGEYGGRLQRLSTGKDETVFAFTRERDGDRIVVMANLSAEQNEISMQSTDIAGAYQDVFSETPLSINTETTFDLGPWEYRVLEKVNGKHDMFSDA